MPWTKRLQIISVTRQHPSEQKSHPQQTSNHTISSVVNLVDQAYNRLWDKYRDILQQEVVPPGVRSLLLSNPSENRSINLITAIRNLIDSVLILALVIQAFKYNCATQRHKVSPQDEFIQEHKSATSRCGGNHQPVRLFNNSSRVICV